METDTEDLSDSDPHECKLIEFKLKARYLLFCTSAKELPTKGNLSQLIKKAMAESGSVENIRLYCFLTPQQLGTLGSKSHLYLLHFVLKSCLMFFVKLFLLSPYNNKQFFKCVKAVSKLPFYNFNSNETI